MLTIERIQPVNGVQPELGNGRPALWQVRYGPFCSSAWVGINSANECPLDAVASLLGMLTFKSPARVVLRKAADKAKAKKPRRAGAVARQREAAA
jgi:hypothetical protein